MYCNTRSFLLLLWFLKNTYGYTDLADTFGQEFYIGILKSYNDNLYNFSLLLTSNTSGTATIYMPYLGINDTRAFNQSLEYAVTQDTIATSVLTVERKGIHVSTDVDVTLTVIRYPFNTYESFLALPSVLLSTSYIISSFGTQSSDDSAFLIVATEDYTMVDMQIGGYIRRVPMDKLETYLYKRNKDLSGTVIHSTKPVAVFSGHEATAIPLNCGYGEHLVEQMLPIKHFAYDFIVPSTPPKSDYMARVYSSEPNTNVTFSNSTSNETIELLDVADFHEALISEPLFISADKPVQVMLYGTCYAHKHDEFGNPFMSLIPSIHQYKSSYHFLVSSTYSMFNHYLVVMTKSEHIPGLRMNGQTMNDLLYTYYLSHEGSNYTLNIYRLTTGGYRLQHVDGKTFGALQYGFDPSDVYAYGSILGLQAMQYLTECGMPNAPDNGRVYTEHGTKYKSIATVVCDVGFVLIGSNTAVCEASGSWISSSPSVCVIKDCGMPDAPEHGSVNLDNNGTTYQSTATFSCHTGFGLTGSNTTVCQANGSWSNTSPACTITGEELTCLECTDMSHPYLCDTVKTCSREQMCYVETFTAGSGQVKFNSGCTDYGQCSRNRRETSTRSPGCVYCCSSPVCNMEGCGSQGLPLRGPLCYDCAHVLSMDECRTVTLCAQDEVCSIERYVWGGLYDHYTAKCHSKQCISPKRSYEEKSVPRMTPRSTPVCRQCCSGDLCNAKCNITSNNGPGAAIVG